MPGPGTGAGGPSFNLDASRWSQADRITGIATLVLFISLFLPWFSLNTGFGNVSADALSAHGYLFIVLILALAIIAFLVLEAGFAELPFSLPLAREQLLLAATGLNLLLVLIAFIFMPGGFGGGVGWSFGAFVGLIAAVVACAPEALPVIRSRSSKR